MPSTYSHTPGPWTCGEPDMFGDYTIASTAEEGSPAIAAVISNVWDGEAVAANARLLAAAPDLLVGAVVAEEALRQAAGALDDHGLGGLGHVLRTQANALRVTIARATGAV